MCKVLKALQVGMVSHRPYQLLYKSIVAILILIILFIYFYMLLSSIFLTILFYPGCLQKMYILCNLGGCSRSERNCICIWFNWKVLTRYINGFFNYLFFLLLSCYQTRQLPFSWSALEFFFPYRQ
jgi:hypothetical protein